MKSKKAENVLQSGACHVCDGELMDGHRVGCDDLAYYVTAEEAIEQAEAERDAKAVEAHRGCCPELRSDNECHAKFDGLDIYSPYLPKCNSKCTYMNDFIEKLNEE